MTKKLADYYLHRIYAMLRKVDIAIILKPIKAKRGETDAVDTIWLNPKEAILPTFIHECLHILYPRWPESRVKRMEGAIFCRLSARQIANLLAKISELICHG